MKLKTASIVLASALALANAAPAEDLLKYISLSSPGIGTERRSDQKIEVDIDSAIDIKWKLDQLFGALAQLEGMGPTSPLLVRLQSLSIGVTTFLDVQTKLVAFRATAVALRSARQTGTAAQVDAAERAFGTASTEFSTAGFGALEGFKASDPELYAAINAAILKDYAEVARVLQEFLARASNDLAAKLTADHALQVLMTASLVDSSGRTTALHLDGYDSIATGDPVPFGRFQIQLDQRTQDEFAAAKALAPAVTDALNGTLGVKLNASLNELETAIRALPDQLKSSSLAASLEKLASDLTATGKAELQPLIADIRELKDIITSLSQPTSLAGSNLGDPGNLPAVAARIGDAVKLIRRIVDEAPRLARSLTAQIEDRLKQSAPALVDSAKATVSSVINSVLAQSDNLRQLVQQAQEIAGALGLTGDVARAVDTTSRHARDVTPGGSLDTSLDLLTVKGERHPGDTVTISATVRRGTGTDAVTLLQGRQSIRVEKYGWYSETRGALLFVQPTSTLTRNISFQPAPAIGYYWHYGARNRPALNHELALGVGATLTILDFDDVHDMEVGVGAGVTLLHDLFWAGAGRNLQARKNYYYIGINPLALVGLFRK